MKTFEYDGKQFEAVIMNDPGTCRSCSFREMDSCPRDLTNYCDDHPIVFHEIKKKEFDAVKVEENKESFVVKHNNKEYEFRAFTLIDLYKKKFHRREFIKLMERMEEINFGPGEEVISETEFLHLRVLSKNISWLIDNGFGKQIVKETMLEPGMVLVSDKPEKEELVYINKDKLIMGKGWILNRSWYDKGQAKLYPCRTLEKLNKYSLFTWKIKPTD